jgi:hypothetical protein
MSSSVSGIQLSSSAMYCSAAQGRQSCWPSAVIVLYTSQVKFLRIKRWQVSHQKKPSGVPS